MDITEIQVGDHVRWHIWSDEPEIRGVVSKVDHEAQCVNVDYTTPMGRSMRVMGPPAPYKLVMRRAA